MMWLKTKPTERPRWTARTKARTATTSTVRRGSAGHPQVMAYAKADGIGDDPRGPRGGPHGQLELTLASSRAEATPTGSPPTGRSAGPRSGREKLGVFPCLMPQAVSWGVSVPRAGHQKPLALQGDFASLEHVHGRRRQPRGCRAKARMAGPIGGMAAQTSDAMGPDHRRPTVNSYGGSDKRVPGLRCFADWGLTET